MSSELIISVSGLRGVVGKSLTPEVAMRYATAFAGTLPPGSIIVGRDGRDSGPALARAIGQALAMAGRRMVDVGVVATPTIGVLVNDMSAAGGIQISASHNPRQYNGIKLFSDDGRVLPARLGLHVLKAYRLLACTPIVPIPHTQDVPDSGNTPRQHCISAHLALIEGVCDIKRIRSKRFRVLLDANHGAGGQLGRALLDSLGCDSMLLGDKPDGDFAHPPEPTEANLANVLHQVRSYNVTIGFCQDPDADRLAIIDEAGRYIGEEKTLALCVDHVLRSGRLGPVVTNCSTSRMSEDIARKYGAPFFRSKVGEANVVDLMLEKNAVIGGEGNGGVIDPRVGYVRDSFVGMALVLDAMASRDMAVSELADELPQYAIHKAAVTVPAGKAQQALNSLERHFSDATTDRLDGLRLDWPSGAWLLVRTSNTEPIVRIIAEATTIDEAKRLCDDAAQIFLAS